MSSSKEISSSKSIVSSGRGFASISLPIVAKSSTKSVGKKGFLRVCVKLSTSSASLEHIYNDRLYDIFVFKSTSISSL